MDEVWKAVPDVALEASSLGRIRNAVTRRVYSPGRQTNGYLMVCPRLPTGRLSQRVHRLVCSAFHGPPPAGFECDHINGCRDDNRAENLRWISLQENRARRRHARGAAHGSAKLSADDVRAIRALFSTTSNTALGQRFGVSRRAIADIRNGVTWQ